MRISLRFKYFAHPAFPQKANDLEARSDDGAGSKAFGFLVGVLFSVVENGLTQEAAGLLVIS